MTADPGLLALTSLLLPAASFLILAVAAPLRRAGRPAAYLSILFAAGSLAAAIAAWRGQAGVAVTRLAWEWLPAQGQPLATVGALVDGSSTVMLMLVALVALLVQVYSLGYLSEEPPPGLGRYFTYQSLFAFSMMGLVLAPNLVQLFICWELVGLCSYLLIGFWYQKPEAARAAVKAFWTTKAGDVGLLIGIVLLWQHSGTFDLNEMRLMVAGGEMPVAGLSLITFCIYLGAMGKSAQFPLHVWLPDAMEGPTPVSALIHAATMVTAGVYLLHRTAWLFALTPDVLLIVAWIGAFTALLAAVLACVQDDIKRVLAYSTVSQLGYMMAAAGAGAADAGFFHLLTHGLFKALLFLGAGAVIHAVGSNDIFRMGGLFRAMPQTGLVFLVGTLALAGVPPLTGFFSKEAVLGGVWEARMTWPFLMLAVTAFLTAFYMFRVVFTVFFGDARGGSHAHEPAWAMRGPLWLLAGLTVVLGLRFAAGGGARHGPTWLAPLSVALALAGIVLAWAMYQRGALDPRRVAAAFPLSVLDALARRRYGLDALYGGVYRGVVLAFSRLIGWIDRYLVDGMLNVVSAWTLRGGDMLRGIQSGVPQDYVYGVAFGVLLLFVWARLWMR